MAARLRERRARALPGARELTHPPPPWTLDGPVLILPARVGKILDAGGPSIAAVRRGRGVGGLVLGSYEGGSTLRYSELLGVGGMVASRGGAGFWIPFARVDAAGSVAGGRAIWDIPKELADFAWAHSPERTRVTVSDEHGTIVRVAAGRSRGAFALPVLAPFLGRGGQAVGVAHGRFRGGPARVAVDVPDGSPLHGLGLSFSPVGLLGRARLWVHAPRPAGRS